MKGAGGDLRVRDESTADQGKLRSVVLTGPWGFPLCCALDVPAEVTAAKTPDDPKPASPDPVYWVAPRHLAGEDGQLAERVGDTLTEPVVLAQDLRVQAGGLGRRRKCIYRKVKTWSFHWPWSGPTRRRFALARYFLVVTRPITINGGPQLTSHARSVIRTVAALTACTAFLAGCSSNGGYNLTRPPFAGSPACPTLTGNLPDKLAGHSKEKSDVRGAVAWGDGDIILYCGMPKPDTTAGCLTENGVDWINQKPADDQTAKMVATYGRSPAVQVRFRSKSTDAAAVLSSLATAVRDIKATKHCTAAS